MKLQYDQSLSYRFVKWLADLFPNSSHVNNHFMTRAGDGVIWEFARANGYTLVTKDADYRDMRLLRGHPPKVIWLRVANRPDREIENLLRSHAQAILDFETDASVSMLTLA